jgi:hypothetical protein
VWSAETRENPQILGGETEQPQMAMDNNPSSKRADVVFFALRLSYCLSDLIVRMGSFLQLIPDFHRENPQILGGETEQPSDSVEENSGESVKSEDREQFNSFHPCFRTPHDMSHRCTFLKL